MIKTIGGRMVEVNSAAPDPTPEERLQFLRRFSSHCTSPEGQALLREQIAMLEAKVANNG